MTWQRIDENTYIDDTLVTCAEYQLFIDEMCEQGKYYQPDHWTLYQFQEGQDQEPILGVNSFQANGFCQWATVNTNPEWSYRLPTFVEAKKYPASDTSSKLQICYWVWLTEYTIHFVWSSNRPTNPRNINYRAFYFAYLENTLNNQDFHEAFDDRSNFPLDLDLLNVELKIEREGLNIFDIMYARLPKILLDVIRPSDSAQLDQEFNFDRAFGSIKHLIQNSEISTEMAHKLMVDLYTLQERIAGRSPVFEGIRLVKERIK